MKKFISPVVLAAFAVFVLNSCQQDEPAPADARDPFVGSWTVNEHSSQIGASTYTVHINKSTANTTQVEIENFYNVGFTVKAKADISGTGMTFSQQTFNNTYQLHGSGVKTGTNTISQLTYYVNNGSSIDTCTATMSRQ